MNERRLTEVEAREDWELSDLFAERDRQASYGFDAVRFAAVGWALATVLLFILLIR